MEGFGWFLLLVTGAVFGIPLIIRHFMDRAGSSGALGPGFGLVGDDGAVHRSLEGEVEGFEHYVETVARGSGEDHKVTTCFVLNGRGRIPPELTLVRESAWQGLRKTLGKGDVQLDDEDFDKLVNVQGPEDVALAALGHDVRLKVMHFLAAGGEVHAGDLKVPLPGGARPDPSELLGWMLPVARALVAPSVPKALLANLQGDPNPKYRLRCLEALIDSHSGAPEARQALQVGLADPDPHVRLLAAQHLEAGAMVQQALEQLIERDEIDAQVRAFALQRLAQLFRYDAIAPLVRMAIAQDAEPLRRMAVEVAGYGKDATLLRRLRELASVEDEVLGQAVANALAGIGGSEAEDGLLALLRRDSNAVQREAAIGLGKIGTVRCVEPLLPLSQAVLGDATVREAARDAVRAIQSRLGDVGGGRLSMVDERVGVGGLSVNELSEKERG